MLTEEVFQQASRKKGGTGARTDECSTMLRIGRMWKRLSLGNVS